MAVVLDICKSKSSALVQFINTKRVVKCHFSYIRKLISPLLRRLPDEWKSDVLDAIARGDASTMQPQDSDFDETQDDNASQPSQEPT